MARLVLARCVLIPLLTLATVGTVAASGSWLEEVPAVAASSGHSSIRTLRVVPVAADECRRVRDHVSPLKVQFAMRDCPMVAIAPHGRPDDTRGDPIAG
ncbi:MAG: hypothetical protein AB7I48_14830 [Planctomycetaceae bacterium]